MAKKKRGVLGRLWKALIWIVFTIFHVIRWFCVWLYSTLVAVGRKTDRTERHASRVSGSAVSIPLELLSSGKGSLAAFEEKVYSTKSTIGLVLGARGSGKSALGMRLLENVAAKKTRPVYAMGFNQSTLPTWIFCTEELSALPNGAFVLVDEGGIAFSSRRSTSNANQLLSSLIMIARHKDISVLFISQNSANLEINAIRQSDYLLLRKPSLLQMDFERKKISKIYHNIITGFEKLPENGLFATYVYSDEFEGFVANQLPSFWSQKASKSFSNFKLEHQEQKEK